VTKAAEISLTRCLAVEHGKRVVRVLIRQHADPPPRLAPAPRCFPAELGRNTLAA
jgi:hypothetical protein